MISRKTAIVIGAAVVVVLFGSSATTGALWNDRAPFDAGELRSGRLSLLTGDQGTQVDSYTFTEFGGTELKPGDQVQAPLTISNGGTVPLNYRLLGVAGSDDLSAALELNASAVDAEANCPTGLNAGAPSGTVVPLYNGLLVGAVTTEDRSLGVDDSETWCLQVNVTAGAVQDSETTVTFTFEATVG